ncbi:MAG: penicillin-binding protein [Candidatus Absconditabacteria bacterium]|nr:penicillin-binding protein [Candidatus Absconditabacteria bacterium]
MQKIKQNYPKIYGEVRFSSKGYSASSYKKKLFKDWKKVLMLFMGGLFVIFIFWFTKNVVLGLPDISQINNMIFSESTTIQDRNGKDLYKLYEENREYVPFSGISQNMINAIVAMEDQRYWEHSGLDPMGILRAGINNVLRPGAGMQGASTISQQLLKNLLLNKDFKRESFQEKVIRKLREVMLTRKLNNVIEKEIFKENKSIEKDELHKQMKNKVLELYLNYIAFGNNSFGVEAASNIYFSKSAKDLNVLESSILASIPKSPTIYNPYKNKERVIGGLSITDQNQTQIQATGLLLDQILAKLVKGLEATEISKNGGFTKVLESLSSFVLTEGENTYTIKYTVGRKDFALMRMYDDGYISQNELKQAFLQGLTYELRKNRVEMLAPHFVQWVIEELEKEYDKDTLFKGGIIVKTTLDLDQQLLAEESLAGNLAVLQENGANNSSMVYLDSTNGDVLAYVGSINYFDDKIQGQNDMVRRARQSGSAIKPFIYALGFQLLPLTLDTPMFDIPFKIGQDQPNNADGKFSGLLPLRLALAHSRNIPATKMILALGGETVAKPFLKDLGLVGVQDSVEYGYTLALGAAEITMLNLANAYAHLSTNQPAEINPILEIRSRDGSLIYKKEDKKQKEVIPGGIRYLLWNILSEPSNRLAGWVSRFNVQGLSLALKTGTSNVKTDRGNRPRDGWMAVYNGSKVAVFWAGNADGAPMNRNAFGGTIHANPMRAFFGSLVRNNYISNDTIRSMDVTTVDISKISGKIASESTPSEFIVNTMKYIQGPALESDSIIESFEYDILCNGLRSPTTPLDNIKNGYVIQPTTIIPSKIDLAEITDWRKIGSSFTGVAPEGGFVSGEVTYNYPNVFIESPKNPCEERGIQEDFEIVVDIISPIENSTVSDKFALRYAINAERGVRSVVVFSDGEQIANFPYNGKDNMVNEQSAVFSKLSAGNHNIEVMAVDSKGYSNKVVFDINIVTEDKEPPIVLESKTRVSQLDNGRYQVSIILQDNLSYIEYGKIFTTEKTILEFKGQAAVFTLTDLVPVNVLAKDSYGNTLETTINLSL